MKKILSLLLSLSVLALAVPSFAADDTSNAEPVNPKAGGTMKGAAVGGLGGAVVGHPVAGAVAGGVIGHHRRHKAEKKARKQAESNAAATESNANMQSTPTQ